mgnify:FL=1
MMKEKRKGMLQRGIMVAVSALTVVASAGTIMAYEPVSSSDESFEEVVFEDFVEDFGFNDTNNDLISSIDFSQSDSVYIDSDGNQVVYKESSDTYALCTHSMVPSSFILMGEIPQEDVLLKFIHAKDVKNVDIVQMQYIKILLHTQNALIN